MDYLYPNAVIQVFCKAPIPGQVKTRLMPELSAEQACKVHQHLALKTLDLVTQSNLCKVQLWCSPDTFQPFFQQLPKQYSVDLLTQSSEDLGMRMYKALNLGCQNFDYSILIGCDCPSLTKQDLKDAHEALATDYEMVLAPAEDGGYCLIGTKEPRMELFKNIVWGGDQVLKNTREKICNLDLTCFELKMQWDVDHYRDYLRLIDFEAGVAKEWEVNKFQKFGAEF